MRGTALIQNISSIRLGSTGGVWCQRTDLFREDKSANRDTFGASTVSANYLRQVTKYDISNSNNLLIKNKNRTAHHRFGNPAKATLPVQRIDESLVKSVGNGA